MANNPVHAFLLPQFKVYTQTHTHTHTQSV